MGLIQNKVTVSQPVSHIVVENAGGLRGETGSQGPEGPAGAPGQAATVSVGTTTTLPAGSSATVTNTGTTSDAVFNFGIPKGDKGDKGDAGAGLVITGSVATYADLPNDLGPDDAGKAYFVEADGKLYVWSGTQFPADGEGSQFEGPQGPAGQDGQDGAPGQAATITVGSTTTLTPGSSATVTNSGTTSAAILDFGIPAGAAGATGPAGPAGPANTLSIGTVEKGETAAATITGTAPNQTLNLTLPQGDPGPEPDLYREKTGTTISVTDAGVSLKKLNKINGDTAQTTYTGKNLLNIFAGDRTPGSVVSSNGVDCTLNSDGTITMNGTATSQSNFTITTTYTMVGTGHKYVGEIVGGTISNNNYVRIICYDNDYNGQRYTDLYTANTPGATSEMGTNNYKRYRLRVESGTKVENLKVRLMVIDNSLTNLSYEPYTGGVASPNPSYPQDVHTVTGTQTVTIDNGNGQSSSYNIDLMSKNLFDPGLIVSGYGLNYPDGTTYSSASRSYLNYTEISEGQTYAISGLRIKVVMFYSDKTTSSAIGGYSGNDTFLQITAPAGAKYIRIAFDNTLDYSNAQLEKGSTATAYEAFWQIELCKIGTYQDYIYNNNGDWYLHKETGAVAVSSGTYGWLNNCAQSVSKFPSDRLASSEAICSGFVYNSVQSQITTNLNSGEFGFNTSECITFKWDSFSSVNDFNTWVSNNDPKVYYVLSTPTDTQITNADLIAQLNALNSAATYEGETNITNTANLSNLVGSLDLDYWTWFYTRVETVDLSSLVSSSFASSVSRCVMSVYGRVATLEMYCTTKTLSGESTILTIPEQYRPGHIQTIYVTINDGSKTLPTILTTNGDLQKLQGVSSGDKYRFGGSWIIGA